MISSWFPTGRYTDAYKGLLGGLDVVHVEVPACDGLGQVGGGRTNFFADVLRRVPESLGARASGDRTRRATHNKLAAQDGRGGSRDRRGLQEKVEGW